MLGNENERTRRPFGSDERTREHFSLQLWRNQDGQVAAPLCSMAVQYLAASGPARQPPQFGGGQWSPHREIERPGRGLANRDRFERLMLAIEPPHKQTR